MADSCDATEPFRSLVLRSLALLPPHVSELSHNDESLHLPRLAGTNVDTAVLGGLGTSIMQHPSFLRLISQAAPLNEWKRVVAAIQASGSLRITVLGVSPTAGAGADNTARNTPAVGWARRLHDSTACLAKHLLNMSVRTEVHAKNAVGSDYFTWCTRRMVRPSANIVLYEMAAAQGSNSNATTEGYKQLLRSGRKAAPHAVHVLVQWPPWHAGRESGHIGASVAATKLDAEVLWGHRALEILTNRSNRAGHRSYYAQHGRDIVHPGPTGHQLLAAATSLLLITRLHAARNCTNSFVPLKTARGAARSRGSTAEQEFSDAEPARDAEERCFPSADLLPAEQPLHGTWALRDEGARKGVRKVGLVSEQAGDKLVLRIPSLANGTSCQGRVVGLGYLASTHPAQGEISVSCAGCGCSRIAGKYTNRGAFQFPEVNTHLQAASFGRANVSITDITSFTVMQMQDTPCRVVVEHSHRHPLLGGVALQSRIRVDSLFVRSAKDSDVRTARSNPWQPHFANFMECCLQRSSSMRRVCGWFMKGNGVV